MTLQQLVEDYAAIIDKQKAEADALRKQLENVRGTAEEVETAGKAKVEKIEKQLEEARLEVERLREALGTAIPKLAHEPGCIVLLPTAEWTREHGNRRIECTCEIAALKELAHIAVENCDAKEVEKQLEQLQGYKALTERLLEEARQERDALQRRIAMLLDGLVRMQKHRDAWRRYAYGRGERPADFLGAGPSLEGPTIIETLSAERDNFKRWYDAVQDALVVNWTLDSANKDDPRRALNDLICQGQKEALDPAISTEAAALRDTYKPYKLWEEFQTLKAENQALKRKLAMIEAALKIR